jgi:kanamycin kinase
MMTSWRISGVPGEAVDVPAFVADLAAGRTVRPVWRNELGGLTFEVLPASSHDSRRFVKWAPPGSPLDLPGEAARLEWAGRFTRVPEPIDAGSDASGSWLVTRAMDGESAVSPRWMQSPGLAVRAIGLGLRALHDSLPPEKCPYTWSVPERLARAKSAAKRPDQWAEDHRWLTFEDAWELLDDPPPIDKLVVCHGDACAPNTLIAEDGSWAGHVDLGALGLADRWADLAIATWSLEWNYGPGWDALLLRSYGIAPDPVRMRYYRVLWDLNP